MDVDEVINTLCPFGYHQKKFFWTVAFSMIITAFQQIHNVFLGAEPEFTCIQGGEEVAKCGAAGSTCDSYKFSGKDFTSIASQVSQGLNTFLVPEP